MRMKQFNPFLMRIKQSKPITSNLRFFSEGGISLKDQYEKYKKFDELLVKNQADKASPRLIDRLVRDGIVGKFTADKLKYEKLEEEHAKRKKVILFFRGC